MLPYWRTATASLALLSFLAAARVLATDDHTYGPNEYGRVNNGLAPNHRFSIATHGEGEDGLTHFHVYLMAEPGHRKIGPLEEVQSILDTAPDAFDAFWSPDSRHVAITHRESRHVQGLALYRIENGRAYLVRGPELIDAAANVRHFPLGDRPNWNWNARLSRITWISAKRFVLDEHGAFTVGNTVIARGLGPFVTTETVPPADTADGTTRYLLSFSAKATCDLTTNDRYRTVDLLPSPDD